MYRIQQLTDSPNQLKTIVLPDGVPLRFSLYFVPMQLGWFIPELTYADFTLKGLRVTNNPNMLHQFRNQIPFGLGCFSTTAREPSLQPDFLSAASSLYVLTEAEVDAYAEYLSG